MTTAEPLPVHQWGQGLWPVLLEIARMPRFAPAATDAELVRTLAEEAEIVAEFRRYHVYYESGELDSLMDLFTEDCVVVNPRGTFVGREVLRPYLGHLIGRLRFHLHLSSNVTVRVVSADEAWLTSYRHGLSVRRDGTSSSDSWGTYVNHMRKEDRWRVCEQRITSDWPAYDEYAASRRSVMPTTEAPPTVEVSAFDLLSRDIRP